MKIDIANVLHLVKNNPNTYKVTSLTKGRTNVIRTTAEQTKIMNFNSMTGDYLGTMHRYRKGAITNDMEGDFLIYEGTYFGEKRPVMMRFEKLSELREFMKTKLSEFNSKEGKEMEF